MSLNPKDANDLALSAMGSVAVWAGDNFFQIIGMCCTVMTLIFVARRYYRDAETARLQQEKLRIEIEAMRSSQ